MTSLDWFDEERRGFVLDESAQSLLIREFETSSEKKQSMSFYKLVEPLITKTYQPLDGQTVTLVIDSLLVMITDARSRHVAFWDWSQSYLCGRLPYAL